jgi:intein/homing endonuclease
MSNYRKDTHDLNETERICLGTLLWLCEREIPEMWEEVCGNVDMIRNDCLIYLRRNKWKVGEAFLQLRKCYE